MIFKPKTRRYLKSTFDMWFIDKTSWQFWLRLVFIETLEMVLLLTSSPEAFKAGMTAWVSTRVETGRVGPRVADLHARTVAGEKGLARPRGAPSFVPAPRELAL